MNCQHVITLFLTLAIIFHKINKRKYCPEKKTRKISKKKFILNCQLLVIKLFSALAIFFYKIKTKKCCCKKEKLGENSKKKVFTELSF